MIDNQDQDLNNIENNQKIPEEQADQILQMMHNKINKENEENKLRMSEMNNEG